MSLFPFLSILACLIGALTILIVALSVSEILQGRKDEAVARAEDYLALEKEVEDMERRKEELRRSSAAMAELARMQPRLAKVKEDLESLETVEARRDTLMQELEKQREEWERIRREKNRVEADLVEGKKKLGELAKQLAKGMPLRVLSTSDYFRRVAPVFVEARQEGIVVHSPSQTVTVPRAGIGTHPKYRQVVDYAAARDDRILVFLVRADGRVSFHQARDFARANGVVTSKVPLPGAGDIDLKEFFRKPR